jgi:hypothetical protein
MKKFFQNYGRKNPITTFIKKGYINNSLKFHQDLSFKNENIFKMEKEEKKEKKEKKEEKEDNENNFPKFPNFNNLDMVKAIGVISGIALFIYLQSKQTNFKKIPLSKFLE